MFTATIIEINRHVAHRLITPFSIFLQTFAYNALQLFRQIRRIAQQRRWLFIENGRDGRCGARARKRLPPAQHLVKHHGKAKDVAAPIKHFASHLLG